MRTEFRTLFNEDLIFRTFSQSLVQMNKARLVRTSKFFIASFGVAGAIHLFQQHHDLHDMISHSGIVRFGRAGIAVALIFIAFFERWIVNHN